MEAQCSGRPTSTLCLVGLVHHHPGRGTKPSSPSTKAVAAVRPEQNHPLSPRAPRRRTRPSTGMESTGGDPSGFAAAGEPALPSSLLVRLPFLLLRREQSNPNPVLLASLNASLRDSIRSDPIILLPRARARKLDLSFLVGGSHAVCEPAYWVKSSMDGCLLSS